MSDFDEEVVNRIDAMSRNDRLQANAAESMRTSLPSQYSYMPGSHIPIRSPEALWENPIDYMSSCPGTSPNRCGPS